MNDYGLDLAVISTCRIAMLIDPASKIVWIGTTEDVHRFEGGSNFWT
ncbi:MAG: hypothetical protein ACREC9_11955 [Methylocella sp.]